MLNPKGGYLAVRLVDLDGVPLLHQGRSPGAGRLQVDLHRADLLVAWLLVGLAHQLDADGGDLREEGEGW